MAAKTSRILITGDVRGCINALNERVKGIVTKNGPFDMILCTGDFFGDTGTCGKRVRNKTEHEPGWHGILSSTGRIEEKEGLTYVSYTYCKT